MTDEWMMMHCVCICRETHMGFPGGSDSKESACSAEDQSSIPRLGRSPGEGHWQLSSIGSSRVFLPGESPGPRSLVDYNPWCRKESDGTERLTHFQLHYREFTGEEIESEELRDQPEFPA